MVSADTFYEGKDERNERYIELLREAALTEQEHVTRMLPWLRQDGYMRSAAILGAAEAAKTLCDANRHDGVEDMIDGVLQRAEQPGEFLAYWFSIAGKAWPRRYRRVRYGVKRAVERLYTEFSYNKWDSAKRGIRFSDVISIVHPTPADDGQSDLYKLILDRRYGNKNSSTARLPIVEAAAEWRKLAVDDPRNQRLLHCDFIKDAGLTWEDMMSALGGKVDKKVLWESVIPNMGVMALMRNLRNFDEAGIGDDLAAYVGGAISDPERIRKARLFPFRFLAAHRAVPSLRWGHVLEKGLNASLENVPVLKGRTLILVDRSPSMFPDTWGSTPNESDISLADQAAVFGAALAVKAESATLVEFGGDSGMRGWGARAKGVGSRKINVPKGASVLKVVDSFGESIPGTDIPRAVKDNLTREHDRVVIVTDEQSRPPRLAAVEHVHGHGGEQETRIDDLVPQETPVYMWSMVGYSSSILDTGGANRHAFGSLSDASFRLIQQLERGKNAKWPWETA